MDWETSEEYMGAKRGGACPHVSCVKLQWAAYWQNPSQQRRRRTWWTLVVGDTEASNPALTNRVA